MDLLSVTRCWRYRDPFSTREISDAQAPCRNPVRNCQRWGQFHADPAALGYDRLLQSCDRFCPRLEGRPRLLPQSPSNRRASFGRPTVGED